MSGGPTSDHVVYSPQAFADLGPHIFPIEKYAGVYRRLRDEDGVTQPLEAAQAADTDLLRVHTPEYLDDLASGRHTPRTESSELPLSPEITAFFRLACGGTILAARRAIERGWSIHIGGGFHHAFADRAEGFCYLNDLAVAARAMQAAGHAARVTIVDLDVHQGNGTAAIFHRDPTVYTFSVHQQDNYPLKQRGDRDIGLFASDDSRPGAGFVTDEVYLGIVEPVIGAVLDASRPDLVLYQAGADPFEHDQLGGFRLTMEGLRRRDDAVVRACRARGVPIAITLGGGYAADVTDTIAIHTETARAAARVFGDR